MGGVEADTKSNVFRGRGGGVEMVALVQGTETSSVFLFLRMRIGRRENGEDGEKRGQRDETMLPFRLQYSVEILPFIQT